MGVNLILTIPCYGVSPHARGVVKCGKQSKECESSCSVFKVRETEQRMREFFLGFKYSQLSQGKECESSCSVFDKCGKQSKECESSCLVLSTVSAISGLTRWWARPPNPGGPLWGACPPTPGGAMWCARSPGGYIFHTITRMKIVRRTFCSLQLQEAIGEEIGGEQDDRGFWSFLSKRLVGEGRVPNKEWREFLFCSNSDGKWRLICVGDHTCYGGAHRQRES